MHVLLVNPCIRPDTPKLLPNVGLAYVASAIQRAGFELSILDIDAHRYREVQIDSQLRGRQVDVIAMGTLTSHYGWIKGFARLCKEIYPLAPLIIGNTLGTSVPQVLLEKTCMDYCVMGEGEITIIELLAALDLGAPVEEIPGLAYRNNGRMMITPERETIKDVSRIPAPNWDLFEIDRYLEASHRHIIQSDQLPLPREQMVSLPVTTARGCPFTCTFCYHAFQGTKYRHRSADSIVDEMLALKARYGVNFINFWDELSFSHPKQVMQLADLLIEKQVHLHFVASCRADLFKADDFAAAKRLREAGCLALSYSLENADEAILEAMNKKCDSADFVIHTQVLKEAGIDCTTSLVLGYPQETRATIRKTFAVLEAAKMYPSVGYLEPMPGTPMYETAKTMGVITDDEEYLLKMGDRQDLRVNLTTMTNEELQTCVKDELIALHTSLKLNLSDLMRTSTPTPNIKYSFLQGFGVAADVAASLETC